MQGCASGFSHCSYFYTLSSPHLPPAPLHHRISVSFFPSLCLTPCPFLYSPPSLSPSHSPLHPLPLPLPLPTFLQLLSITSPYLSLSFPLSFTLILSFILCYSL